MGKTSYADELKREFPDLGESMWYHSEDKARDLLQQLREVAESNRHNAHKRLVADLESQFPSLSSQTIHQVLMDADWDEETAIVQLVGRATSVREPSAEEAQLINLFGAELGEDTVRALYEANEGDAEATANAILDRVSGAAARELDRAQEDHARVGILRDLVERFDGVEATVVEEVLQAADWDVESATVRLVDIAEDLYVERLAAVFPEYGTKQLRRAVYAAQWKLPKAVEILTTERERHNAAEAEAEAEAAAAAAADERMQRSLIVSSSVAERIAERKEAFNADVLSRLEEALASQFGPNAEGGDDEAEEQPFAENDADAGLGESVDAPSPAAAAAEARGPVRRALLAPSATVVAAGTTVKVSFKMLGGAESRNTDWLAMMREGRSASRYTTYQWLPAGATEGALSFTPKADGHYVFRLLSDRTDVEMATSEVVRVGPIFELTAEQVSTREAVVKSVLVEGVPSKHTWIGLYRAGETNHRAFVSYQYRDASGSQVFAVPKAGSWEVRLFSDYSYHPATAAALTMCGEDALSVRCNGAQTVASISIPSFDPSSDRVWVGLFFVDAASDSVRPRRWQWVRGNEGELIFSTPRTAGTYHARLFALNATTPVLTSSTTFEVSAQS